MYDLFDLNRLQTFQFQKTTFVFTENKVLDSDNAIYCDLFFKN